MAENIENVPPIGTVQSAKFKNSATEKQLRLYGFLIFIFSILLFIALISYTKEDAANSRISFGDLFALMGGDEIIQLKAEMTQNWLGLVGAFISDILINSTYGYAICLMPLFLILLSKDLIKNASISESTLRYLIVYLNVSMLFAGTMGAFHTFYEGIPNEWFGNVGVFLGEFLSNLIGAVGTIIILSSGILVTLYVGTDLNIDNFLARVFTAGENSTKKLYSGLVNLSKPPKFEDENYEESNKSAENEIENPIEAVVENPTPAEEVVDSEGTTKAVINPIPQEIANPIEDEVAEPIQVMQHKAKTLEPTIPLSSRKINITFNKNAKVVSSFDKEYESTASVNQTPAQEENEESKNHLNSSLQVAAQEKANNNIFEAKSIEDEDTSKPIANTFVEIEKQKAKPISFPSISIEAKDEFDIFNELEQFNSNISSSETQVTQIENIAINQTIPVAATTQAIENRNENLQLEEATNIVTPEPILNLSIKQMALSSDVQLSPELEFSEYERREIPKSTFSPTLSQHKPLNVVVNSPIVHNTKAQSLISVSVHDEEIDYSTPGLDLLAPEKEEQETINELELETNARILQEKLETFKIYIENLSITPGPVVTQYEFVPADGIKISKIEGLQNDIAMALKARGIRIIAPVPGKGTVGVEIPNSKPSLVTFRSLIDSKAFEDTELDLPIALGKSISGEVIITDLTKMPHLLIAGSTGSGKSVGINTIIASLLYKKKPNEMKFVIIDPKKVELQQYKSLKNHFMAACPDINDTIITKPEDAVTVLKSAVIEMEKRYDILADAGQRNIKDYNKKIVDINLKKDSKYEHKAMPFIVIIVDELADLMLTASKEIVQPIARLAQMARAVGIHLILATQRPSVDVITGVIKANFPARMAYAVASAIDSRTILDSTGAEQLLGNGDMLFFGNGALTPIRIQNSYLSTDEVDKICDFIGEQTGYSQAYELPSVIDTNAASANNIDASDYDELLEQSARLVIALQSASTSKLQSKFSIGYQRAARIMDQLESLGIIGPQNGSKGRAVHLESESELEHYL